MIFTNFVFGFDFIDFNTRRPANSVICGIFHSGAKQQVASDAYGRGATKTLQEVATAAMAAVIIASTSCNMVRTEHAFKAQEHQHDLANPKSVILE